VSTPEPPVPEPVIPKVPPVQERPVIREPDDTGFVDPSQRPVVQPVQPVQPIIPLEDQYKQTQVQDTGYVPPYVPVENLHPIREVDESGYYSMARTALGDGTYQRHSDGAIVDENNNVITQQPATTTGGLNSVSDAVSELAPTIQTASTTPVGGLNVASTQVTDQPSTLGDTDLVSQVTAWRPSNEWAYDPNNRFAGTNITLADGQVVPYNAIVDQVLKRYDQDKKNPTLAVKSGIELGISDDVLKTLPGVDAAALAAGHQLVDSGAFGATAINEGESVAAPAPAGSEMYKARMAAGLDAYGYPPEQVKALKAAGKYREPNEGGLNQTADNSAAQGPVATTGGLNAVSTTAAAPAGGLSAASQTEAPFVYNSSGAIVGREADANTPGAYQVPIGEGKIGTRYAWVTAPTGAYATQVQVGTNRDGTPIYGSTSVITPEAQRQQVVDKAQADAANFVEPAWVSKAPSIIGTAVEAVYPTMTVERHNGPTQVQIPGAAPSGYRYDNGKSQYVYLDMDGKVTSVENRGNGMLVPLLETAISFAFPELAPFIQGANAVQAIQSGNIIGGLASLAGAGGFSDVSSVLNTANAIKTGNISGIVGGLMNNPTINSIAGDISLAGGISLADAGSAINLVNNIKTGNVAGVLANASALTGSQDLQTASTAASIVTAVQKGNIAALTGLVSNLSNVTDAANNITDQNVLTDLATKVDEATGNDTTVAGTGTDTISGGLNQTSVAGSGGNDSVTAAAGNDVVGGLNQTSVTGAKGNDVITAVNDTSTGADTALTGDKTTLTGAAGNDTISGGLNQTSVTGVGGNDTVVAAGNDTVTGGLNQTSVAGAGGNDTVTAAAGNDTLTGGKTPAGATTFANNVLTTALGGKKTTSNLVGRNVITGTKPKTTTTTAKTTTTTPGALTTASKQLTAAQIAAAKATKVPTKVNVATLTPIKTTTAPPKKVDVSKLTPIKIATTLPPALANLKKPG